MIVTVRRWTSIALPRLKARQRAMRVKASKKEQTPEKQQGFIESFERMFEHQVNLMFRDDLHK